MAVDWLLQHGADPDKTLAEAVLMSMRRLLWRFIAATGRWSGMDDIQTLYIPTASPSTQDGLSKMQLNVPDIKG